MIETDGRRGKIMCVFEMYKIAIEGRNKHYENYNEWVNLYSIFTGALFIAYYTIADKGKPFLSLAIAASGTFASLCWHLSVMGYYSWMLSWIDVVHDYEEELNTHCSGCSSSSCPNKCSGYGKKLFVYSVFKGTKCNGEHVSTQKVTKVFVGFLCVMWNALLGASLLPVSRHLKGLMRFLPGKAFSNALMVFAMLLAVLSEIWFYRSYREGRLLSSVGGMKSGISG